MLVAAKDEEGSQLRHRTWYCFAWASVLALLLRQWTDSTWREDFNLSLHFNSMKASLKKDRQAGRP